MARTVLERYAQTSLSWDDAGFVLPDHRDQYRPLLRVHHYQGAFSGSVNQHGVSCKRNHREREPDFHHRGHDLPGSLGKTGDTDDRERRDGNSVDVISDRLERAWGFANLNAGQHPSLCLLFRFGNGARTVADYVGDFPHQSARPGCFDRYLYSLVRNSRGHIHVPESGKGPKSLGNVRCLWRALVRVPGLRVENDSGNQRPNAGTDPEGVERISGPLYPAEIFRWDRCIRSRCGDSSRTIITAPDPWD